VSKLKPTEVALILERVRKTAPSEAESLTTHIESLGSEDGMMQLVREMVESKQQSIAAEAKTDTTLQAWKPVMDAVATAISKIATEEKRRNDIEERKLGMEHETRSTVLEKMLVPLVSAIAGAITAAAGFHFAG
jgi:hypothetical protein